jgi:hypothetical protein
MSASAVIILGFLVLVPGLGATLAAWPAGRISLPTRLALAVAAGCSVTALVAYALAVTHLLHPVPFFALLAVVTVALWSLGLWRDALPAHARALRDEVRHDGWVLGVGLAVIIGIGVLRWQFSPLASFQGVAPFRYWGDALEIVDAGRIPELSLQYGDLYPPAISKVLLNTFNAGVVLALGREALPALGAVLWVTSVSLAVVLWALGRELGLRLTAPLLPVLTVANGLLLNGEISGDMDVYRPETHGRLAAFTALLLGIRGLRALGLTDRILAGVAGGVAAATHLVPLLVAMAMLGWYGVGRALATRELQATAARLGTTFLIAAVAGALLLALPRGDVGLQGAARPDAYSGLGPAFDPTAFFARPDPTVRGVDWTQRHASVGPAYVAAAFGLDAATGRRLAIPLGALLLVGGLAVAILMLLWFPEPLRPIGLLAWGLGVTLVLGALLFRLRFHTYIASSFGVRRLFDYTGVPIVLVALAGVEAGAALLARTRPRLALGGVLVAVAVVAAVVVPTAPARRFDPKSTRASVDLLDWVRANVPCDARILATQQTVGVFKVMSGRAAILEGMAPYLRPQMLAEVVDVLIDARRFFLDPVTGQEFLRVHGVEYVVVLKRLRLGHRIAPLDPGRFRRAPGLGLVYATPEVDIYRSESDGDLPGLPDVSDAPGYRCERGPIFEAPIGGAARPLRARRAAAAPRSAARDRDEPSSP